ncbi:MAG: hypothetical protein EOO59_02030 [Hymenobacter sp.]|nr:MAG: hypothetical protein EOO59_02030 [Hymenobacter sp.]
MKPLIVLLAAFCLALAATRLFAGQVDYLLAGNVAMAVMLIFTGIAHVPYVRGMAQMLPAWLPAKHAWIYGTGLLEVAGGVGLLLPAVRPLAATCLLVFFVLIFPGNVISARKHLDYQRGTLTGPGLGYLWFRVPLQLLFLGWTWYFGLHLAGA